MIIGSCRQSLYVLQTDRRWSLFFAILRCAGWPRRACREAHCRRGDVAGFFLCRRHVVAGYWFSAPLRSSRALWFCHRLIAADAGDVLVDLGRSDHRTLVVADAGRRHNRGNKLLRIGVDGNVQFQPCAPFADACCRTFHSPFAVNLMPCCRSNIDRPFGKALGSAHPDRRSDGSTSNDPAQVNQRRSRQKNFRKNLRAAQW